MSFYLPMILGLAVLVLANLKGALFGGSARYVSGRFLTRNEKEFLAELDEALGSNCRVFVQVRLGEDREDNGDAGKSERQSRPPEQKPSTFLPGGMRRCVPLKKASRPN